MDDEDSALASCYAAAAAGTDLFGERAGSPALLSALTTSKGASGHRSLVCGSHCAFYAGPFRLKILFRKECWFDSNRGYRSEVGDGGSVAKAACVRASPRSRPTSEPR